MSLASAPSVTVPIKKVQENFTNNTTVRGPGFLFRRDLCHVRKKWELLGLFEIDSKHEFFALVCMIKKGLQDAIQVSIDCPSRQPLKNEDYSSVLTHPYEDCEMGTFAGPVFAHLRQFLGLAEKDYQRSLTSSCCFLQFISNSKSKANLFLTNDRRFFLKTQRKWEIQFLLSKLILYIHYLHEYPHTLLVKFLGIHSIKMPREKKKYFIIMQNIFYPDDQISKRYDIKGCQVDRWTRPQSEDNPIIVVLKDLNFEGHIISLGSQRKWILKQIELDTTFLRNLNVLDYSLLVAFQKLHLDEKPSDKNILAHVSKSIHGLWVKDSCHLTSDTSLKSPRQNTTSVTLERIQSCNLAAHNCRLLPDVTNALHILDGPDHRYFIGITDFFIVYSLRKRLEFLWKSIFYPGQSFSTVNPTLYARRLCQWLDTHTE